MFNDYASLHFMSQSFATFQSYKNKEQLSSAPEKGNFLEYHYTLSATKITFNNRE
jgi:hypothetical protein